MLSASSRAAIEAVVAGSDVPLEMLRRIRLAAAALESEQLPHVRQALETASWDEIADAAGLKAPAAKWRWQGSDEEIADRHEQGRKRSERPSSKPTDLPGMSVAEAAQSLGVTAQAIYLRVSRGQLRAETIEQNGRSYKRVFPEPGS